MLPKPKEIIALILVIAAGFFGIFRMLEGESHVNLAPGANVTHAQLQAMLHQGLQPYFWGIGTIFLLVGLAIVFADGSDNLKTRADLPEEEV